MEAKGPKVETPRFKGEILLCEDNEINQHFIKSHLNRTGLEVSIAADGREGIEAIQGRISSGAKPFDLIFMDIQMPVMGGLEAAGIITKLGVKTPIVALTSNVTAEDQRVYAEHGMSGSLCKPFAAEQLWECLGEYLESTGSEAVDEGERLAEEEKQRRKLFSSFVRRNQTTYEDICAAIDTGNIKLAHRLAHTLRGLAGLMKKNELMEAARIVEHALADGNADSLPKDALETVGRELKAVLTELAPYMDEVRPAAPVSWDKDAARELFDKLEPLLLGDNAASQQFVDALRTIPESSELITQLEDYEFEAALDALAKLRSTLCI